MDSSWNILQKKRKHIRLYSHKNSIYGDHAPSFFPDMSWPGLLKKNNRKCNGLNGYNGNCIGFNGNYNGVYWYVMDSIGGMLNTIGKMPKTH